MKRDNANPPEWMDLDPHDLPPSVREELASDRELANRYAGQRRVRRLMSLKRYERADDLARERQRQAVARGVRELSAGGAVSLGIWRPLVQYGAAALFVAGVTLAGIWFAFPSSLTGAGGSNLAGAGDVKGPAGPVVHSVAGSGSEGGMGSSSGWGAGRDGDVGAVASSPAKRSPGPFPFGFDPGAGRSQPVAGWEARLFPTPPVPVRYLGTRMPVAVEFSEVPSVPASMQPYDWPMRRDRATGIQPVLYQP